MAIANKNDLTHIVRTTQQWTTSYDSYECIPEGVLCVEFTPDGHVKAKIGNGHDIFSKLPYIGGADLTNYFTKNETVKCIEDIIKAKRFICIKGILQNKDQLPSHAECGDLYFVISQNQSSSNKYDEYVYSPSNTWENLGSIPIDIDLSEYAKIVYVDEKIDEVNERIDDIEQHGTHTHANKDILDLITAAFTAEEKDKLSTLYNYDDTELRELITQASHTHSNKDILDAISAAFTTEDRVKLDSLTPYDDTILKEKITALERLAHEHSNKRILDRTTASFTTEYERKMRWIRIYTGCTGMEEGIAGLVPAAQAGEEDYVLSGSGEWVPQTGGGGTYELPIASASTLGGIKVGNGLEIDANGVLSTTGGGGDGDSIAEGDGITITTDPQTGVKTISVNTGDNLEVDPNTGELNVTGVDYTAGKGIFIGNEYQNVEYIKNSGNYDQIIITDIVPNFSDKLEMDIKFGAATGNTTNDGFIGCTGVVDNNKIFHYSVWCYCTNSDSNIGFYNHFVWTQYNTGSNFITRPAGISYDGGGAQRLILTMQGTTASWGNTSINFSNEYMTEYDSKTFVDPQIGIAIFGYVNNNKNYFDCQNLTIYGVKLYDSNDTLLHNLIPVKKLSNNEGGLYDTVTNKFYGNSGNGSFVTGPAVETDDRIINAKIGDGLQFDSNNAIEVVTGNGLQINQDGELEIDPSIIPDAPDYRAGDAIEIEHNEYHLSLTDYSNNDFIASIILSVTNGSISKAADNSSFVLSSSYDDCYTRGSNYGSNGSYPYTVKPLTQYRLQWDSTSPGVTGYTMIFENGEYTYVHTGDQGTVSYIDFTTAETTTFIQVRFGIAYAGNTISISNIRLYEYVEDTFEYDKINVKYNKGLNVNQSNELEVVLSDGLQFDSTASETLVADKLYLFNSRVTCQVHTDSPFTGFPSNRTYQKTTIEPALCCLWEVGGADLMWTGPLIVGLTETSVQYTTQDTSQTVNYQNTFTYLEKTWYTSGYPDFLNDADHEDKLDHLQYLGSYSTTADQIQAAKDLIDLANVRFVSNAGIQAKLGNGLSFDANGAIQADAQPLSPATDSTLGGVIVGDGILVDADGTISVDPTIIPEVIEYEAGTAISIEDVEHGGVTFDAWDSGTGWENVCYSDSTGNSVINYQYEAHSPISNSYTLPAGATHIRAIAYDQNDTMLWTSFSWIDSNNYHFASTSPEDGHYNDWFEIPTGAVKVNFGVRHSKLNTTTAMSLNDIKSVDITVQTVSEIEVDVWTGVAGWTNGDYYDGTSDQFTTSWPYTYHYNPSEYIPVPEGALKIRVIGISNENDSHFEGGGANIFDSNHHHIGWLPCCTVTDEWVDIPEGTVYVQPEVKWNNNNTRTISAADIKSVTLVWKLPALEISQAINVKYGNGLTVNQNNELEVNLGSGLQFDANGAIEVVGGGSSKGNGDYTAGDAIEFRSTQLSFNVDAIRWDISNIKSTSQTGGPWTQVRYIEFCDDSGTPYTISSASGIWEDNTSITYSTTGGSQTINDMIANTQKMCAIWRYPNHTMQLTFNLDTAVPCADIAKFRIKLGDDVPDRDPKSWKVYFRDAATQIWYIVQDITDAELSDTRDIWSNYYPFDITGATSINVKYGTGLAIDPITGELFVDGQLPEGTIIKKLTYVGDGSTTNSNIHFSKKPLSILSLNGSVGQNYGSAISTPIDAPYLHGVWGGSTGSGTSFRSSMSYDDTTNTLSIQNTSDVGLAFNISGATYTMYYLTKGHTGSGTSVNNEVSVVKTFSYTGTGTTINNIQFPETPDYILNISGPLGSVGDIITDPIDIQHPTTTSTYIFHWTQNGSGLTGRGLYSFNDSTNVLTLDGQDYGATLNYADNVYYVRYVVNEVIPSQTAYAEGEAISIKTIGGLQLTDYSNDDFVDSIASINAGSIVKAADKSSFTLTASINDCYTRGSSGQANGSYPFNVKASTKYRFAWDSANPTVHGKVYTYENGLYDAMMHEIDQYDSSYLEFTTSANTTFIQARFGVMYAGDSITYSNVRLYEVIETEDEYDEISVKYNKGLTVNQNNELEVNIGTGLAFDPQTGAINVTGGGGGSGDTVAEGAGIEITTDQQTGNKVIAVNAGTGLQVDQTTNELEIDDSVVTEDDELNLVFVPDDYQPS